MSKDTSPNSLDVILNELGPFNKYNIINYALLLYPCFLAGMYASIYVFEALDIDYRCRIDECEEISNETLWLQYAIPKELIGPSKCSRYSFSESFNSTNDFCDLKSFDTSVVEKCTSYVYYGDSVVKDFNLACEDSKRILIGTLHNVGYFIAIPLAGVISDRYGRKVALTISGLMNCIFGLLRSFSVNYYMLMVSEVLEASLGGGDFNTAFVLAMELVPPQGRVIGNTLISLCFIFGSMTLATLAWLFNDWRTLLRVIYAPSGFVFLYLWILNENPRWLLSKGRYEEAVNILKKAAIMNKVMLSDSALAAIENQAKENLNNITQCRNNDEDNVGKNSPEEVKDNSSLFIRVIKSRVITGRVIICSFLYTTCSFVYYGLSINSVSLAGNLYMNFILVSFIEIPANFCYLFVSNRYARKKVLITTYILSALFCIGLSFLPKDSSWLWPLIIFLAGKFSISIAFGTIYVYLSELFPTNARQSLLSVCSSVGAVGFTLAPLTPLIALYNENLPSIIFGALAVIAALLVFRLPETLNQTLPDTIEEAERLSKKKNNVISPSAVPLLEM